MWQAMNRLLSEHLGEAELHNKQVLSGGDIHHTLKVDYGDHTVFIKQNRREFLPHFKEEAEQLEVLAKSQTIKIPKIYGVGNNKNHSFLLLEYIPLKPLTDSNAWLFGQQLARLHQWEEQPAYGFDFDTRLGTTAQPNGWEKRWNSFFAEKRIGFQLQIALEKGMVFGDIPQLVDIVVNQLQGHQPQPSLLHGNLWPANCAIADQHTAVFFDPACYWGDRECDLAMFPLYDHIPVQIIDGYQSVWPLPSDFLRRQPIYQLYYLLNNCNLFGCEKSYFKAQEIVEQLLAE
nr:fructosamine kinase family protein [uncultured Moellerella sp.]